MSSPDSSESPTGGLPAEEPLLDINGNPIPRNWNPGTPAPAPPDAEPPPAASRAPSAGNRPAAPGSPPRPAPRPLTPPPAAPPPPAPAGGAGYGGAISDEEVQYDLAGNPMPSSKPKTSLPPIGAPGSGYKSGGAYSPRPDPAQRGSTSAGRIFGMIAAIVIVVGIIAYIAIVVFMPGLLQRGRPGQPSGSPHGSSPGFAAPPHAHSASYSPPSPAPRPGDPFAHTR